MTAQLAYSADIDRGAERLLRQTEFLAAAYREFERLSNETGGHRRARAPQLLLPGAVKHGMPPCRARRR